MKKLEFTEFLGVQEKLEITYGVIKNVEKLPKSNKMLKLEVDLGKEELTTVVTNIGKGLTEEEAQTKFEDVGYYFVTNLEPANIMGIESLAMILVPCIGEELNLSGDNTIGQKILPLV